jgi:hypothetical protein
MDAALALCENVRNNSSSHTLDDSPPPPEEEGCIAIKKTHEAIANKCSPCERAVASKP